MKECVMPQTLLEMAKDLVLAQIHVHKLLPEDMHPALHDMFSCLLALHRQEASYGLEVVETRQRQPAPRNWRRSITKYLLTCLVCEARFKQLSAHLKTHGLDARSYRMRFGIPRRQPLAARSVTNRRQQTVQKSRPWEKTQAYLKKHEQEQPVGEKRQAPKRGPSRVKK
jgi:predicted transcriptional regulator